MVNLNGMKDSWSLEWIRAQVLQEDFRRKELTAAAGEGGGSAYGMKGFKGRGSKEGKAKEGSRESSIREGSVATREASGVAASVGIAMWKVTHGLSAASYLTIGGLLSHQLKALRVFMERWEKAWAVRRAMEVPADMAACSTIAMFMGADGRLVGVKRVLLVPGLCANLLSTKALSEAGMKMEMMGTKVFKATLDGRVLWDLQGGKDMHRSMWEILVLPWKEAAVRLAAQAIRGGHATHVTSRGGGDGSDGGLLVHGGDALPSVTPSTGETHWLTAHHRFGHVALPQLQQLFKEERFKGLRIKGEPKEVGSCETCLTSKFSRFPFNSAVEQSSHLVELVHVDLVGPMKVKGDGGALYSMNMVDDYTRLTWSFPLANKSDAARVIIEEWLPMVEQVRGKRVKAIRSDRGGEFLGAEFLSWLKRHGIKQQLTTAYTPHVEICTRWCPARRAPRGTRSGPFYYPTRRAPRGTGTRRAFPPLLSLKPPLTHLHRHLFAALRLSSFPPPSSFVSLQPWGGGYGGGGCWSVGSTLSLPLLLLSVPPLQLPLGGEGVRMWGSRGSGTGVAGVRQHAAIPPPLLSSPPSLLLLQQCGGGEGGG
ncbi:unnamed protein product [Closterium sp. NIES-54]